MKKTKIQQLIEKDKEYKIQYSKWYWKIINWLEENIWWEVEKIWTAPPQKIREIKWFIQRGRRGWAEEDVWNLDYYLEKVISGAVGELAKHHISYPNFGEAKTDKNWTRILKKIAIGFKIVKDAEDNFVSYDKIRKAQKVEKESLKLLVKYFHCLWD